MASPGTTNPVSPAIPRSRAPDWANAEPEIVAHHFTKAALAGPAVEWWGKAGELALRHYAYADAITYQKRSLQLADELGEGLDQRRTRLRLQIVYANALRIARGFGMPETQEAFAAASDLAAGIEEVSERFPAYYGLWSGGLVSRQLQRRKEASGADAGNL